MKFKREAVHIWLITLCILASIIVIAAPTMTHPTVQPEISNLQPLISNTQETATSTVYVPLILRNRWDTSRPLPVFGTQFAPFQEEQEAEYAEVVEYDLPLVQQAGFPSIRTHIFWREIEPDNTTPDAFNWTRYDQRLLDYQSRGFETVVAIVGYPKWATQFACGGGLLEGMAAEWRQFVRAAAERYSAAPYNVHIWEIGNEVDGETEVDPEDAERPPPQGHNEPTWPFGGCWGDMAPEYVEFLRIAYEEIKAIDPDATVMPGGLAYSEFGNWFIRDFFDDFLAAGGAAYTDVVGFHWFKLFQPNWPTAIDKARELRGIMANHGVDKPMWLTETYMPDRVLGENTHQERYQFITQELPRAMGSGEIGRIYWFSFRDWPPDWDVPIDRGLVTYDHQPKPGLRVFEIMMEYVDGIPGPESLPGIEAYRFRQPWDREESWVMWSTTDEAQAVTLSAPGTSVTAIRIELGDSYETTRPVPVDVTLNQGQVQIPVGPEAVFVRIQPGSP